METAARKPIEQYLGRVRENLSSRAPAECDEILKGLESHIYEALEARTAGRHATSEDVNAVLEEMDPPESYAGGHTQSPAFSRGALGLAFSLGSVAAATLIIRFAPSLEFWIAHFVLTAGQIAGIILGASGWSQPYGKTSTIVSALILTLSVVLLT